ncbi:MAG TPA: DUF3794 domain-containing protein, partial [Bacillota bacterium]|nr:DUF3794 domain-containing protein [Bacillota bacterium]
MDETKDENLTGTKKTVRGKTRQRKTAVVNAAETIETSSDTPVSKPKTIRKTKKESGAASKDKPVAAIEFPENREKKKGKNGKSKAAATVKSRKTSLIGEDLLMGQGKVQQVRVQVNKMTGSNRAKAQQSAPIQPEVTSLATETVSNGIQLPLANQARVEAVQSAQLPFRAIKVRNVVGKVVDLVTEIIPNKVIIQGIVHEQLFFVGTDGIVHHLADDIPF